MSEVINEIVSRFLAWEFPHDLDPDGGIYFDLSGRSLPVGTNLLTATQAKAMIEHIAGDTITAQQERIALLKNVCDAAWKYRNDITASCIDELDSAFAAAGYLQEGR